MTEQKENKRYTYRCEHCGEWVVDSCPDKRIVLKKGVDYMVSGDCIDKLAELEDLLEIAGVGSIGDLLEKRRVNLSNYICSKFEDLCRDKSVIDTHEILDLVCIIRSAL